MLDLVSSFSSKNDNKFNDDLLLGLRRNDDMADYIEDACKAIVNLLPNNIRYKGYYYNNNKNHMLKRDEGKDADKNKNKKEKRIHINETYAKEAVFEFECSFGGQTVIQKFSLWIPEIYDGYHYYIKGNKYTLPIQIVDAITFTKKNMLVLKTITRAVKFIRKKDVITDIYGRNYNINVLSIFVTAKKSVPVLLYYFAYFGFFKTLQYFQVENYINIYTGSINENVPKDKYFFKFGAVYLGVDKEMFDNNRVFRMFVATTLETCKRGMSLDSIRNPVVWTIYLGETLSTTKALVKGQALLRTFMTYVDYRTADIINKLVPGLPRNDTFSVVRWIFVEYVKLCSKDDGLQNKRIRLNEYIITPFVKQFIDKVYRFMNTPDKLKTMDDLLNVFKIKPSLILNAIIGKISTQLTGLNIAKCSSESNDDALVNVLLPITKSGPGSPSEKSKRLGMFHRQFQIDYVGRIDLSDGLSANDPGMTRYLTPMTDAYDREKQIFNVDKGLLKK